MSSICFHVILTHGCHHVCILLTEDLKLRQDYADGFGGFDGGQSISFHSWSQFRDWSKSYKLTFWWVHFYLPQTTRWQVIRTSYVLLKI